MSVSGGRDAQKQVMASRNRTKDMAPSHRTPSPVTDPITTTIISASAFHISEHFHSHFDRWSGCLILQLTAFADAMQTDVERCLPPPLLLSIFRHTRHGAAGRRRVTDSSARYSTGENSGANISSFHAAEGCRHYAVRDETIATLIFPPIFALSRAAITIFVISSSDIFDTLYHFHTPYGRTIMPLSPSISPMPLMRLFLSPACARWLRYCHCHAPPFRYASFSHFPPLPLPRLHHCCNMRHFSQLLLFIFRFCCLFDC